MLFRISPFAVAFAALSAAVGAADPKEYDYVVVGSGPGGGTLAVNLARAGHSVFLMEAGGDHGDELNQEIPMWWIGNNANPEMAWHFWVEHYQNETMARRDDKYSYQYPNGSIYYGLDPPDGVTPLGILYPRGSTLGGSAQTNAMNFVLPPDSDWNTIAELTGDDSWKPENMREHFIDLSRNEYVEPGTPGHGFDGYISSRQNNPEYVMGRDGIYDIAREGLRLIEGLEPETDEEFLELLQRDANSADPDRWATEGKYLQFPVHVNKDGTRSGARNYVADTLAAKNDDGSAKYPLTLSTNSLATRVLFDESSEEPKAYGVEYLKGVGLYSADLRYKESDKGKKMTVKASKEVIISGGAFNTPQILKLSGIGPRDELERFDIPVVVDLPAVGNYLQDHTESGIVMTANKPFPNNPFEGCAFGATTDPDQDPCLDEWNEDSGSSAYSEAGTPFSMAYRSSVAETDDVDIYFFGAPDGEFRGFYPGFAEAVPPPGLFGWSVVKAHGRSEKGTVELRSNDPRDTPIINFNFFDEGGDKDLQAMAEGVELALEIMEAAGEPYTPWNVTQPFPDMDLKQSIADTVFSHHASCSCRMGTKGDKNYCVDSEFKVNGVQGLRVVDGSVFPHVPGGFPVAATFTISRKAFKSIVSE